MPNNGITLVWACNPPMPIKFAVKGPSTTSRASAHSFAGWALPVPLQLPLCRMRVFVGVDHALLPVAIRPRPRVDRLLISSACSCVIGVSFASRAFSRLMALMRFKCSSSSGWRPPLFLLSPFVERPGIPPQYNARIFPRAAARVLTIDHPFTIRTNCKPRAPSNASKESGPALFWRSPPSRPSSLAE
jgi:hypothetical protein